MWGPLIFIFKCKFLQYKQSFAKVWEKSQCRLYFSGMTLRKDQMQWGLYTWPRSRLSHSDQQSSVIRYLFCVGDEQFHLFNVQYLVCTKWHFDRKYQWGEFNPVKVCYSSSVYCFFHIRLFGTSRNKYCKMKKSIILYFSLQLFRCKTLSVQMPV